MTTAGACDQATDADPALNSAACRLNPRWAALQNSAVEAAQSLFDLTGRVAVVTGASSGLGVHFARVLRSRGAMVVLAGRREDRLNALAREVGSEHAEAVPLDVTDASAMVALIDRAVKRFCPLNAHTPQS